MDSSGYPYILRAWRRKRNIALDKRVEKPCYLMVSCGALVAPGFHPSKIAGRFMLSWAICRESDRLARLDALRSFNFWQRTLRDIEKRGGQWAVSLAKLAWAN